MPDSMPKASICIISFNPKSLPKWILLISLLYFLFKGRKLGLRVNQPEEGQGTL